MSHTPGEWSPSHFTNTEGRIEYATGWYVSRTNNGRTEWMRDKHWSCLRFETEEEAWAAIVTEGK